MSKVVEELPLNLILYILSYNTSTRLVRLCLTSSSWLYEALCKNVWCLKHVVFIYKYPYPLKKQRFVSTLKVMIDNQGYGSAVLYAVHLDQFPNVHRVIADTSTTDWLSSFHATNGIVTWDRGKSYPQIESLSFFGNADPVPVPTLKYWTFPNLKELDIDLSEFHLQDLKLYGFDSFPILESITLRECSPRYLGGQHMKPCPSVKRVYIDCVTLSSVGTTNPFLSIFPNITELYVNCLSCILMQNLPFLDTLQVLCIRNASFLSMHGICFPELHTLSLHRTEVWCGTRRQGERVYMPKLRRLYIVQLSDLGPQRIRPRESSCLERDGRKLRYLDGRWRDPREMDLKVLFPDLVLGVK